MCNRVLPFLKSLSSTKTNIYIRLCVSVRKYLPNIELVVLESAHPRSHMRRNDKASQTQDHGVECWRHIDIDYCTIAMEQLYNTADDHKRIKYSAVIAASLALLFATGITFTRWIENVIWRHHSWIRGKCEKLSICTSNWHV